MNGELHTIHCRCSACAMPAGLATADAIQRSRENARRIEHQDNTPINITAMVGLCRRILETEDDYETTFDHDAEIDF